MAMIAMMLAALAISHVFLTASADDFHRAPTDPQKVAEQMARDYTAALDTLSHLIDQPITLPSSTMDGDGDVKKSHVVKSLTSKGKAAFETALRVFPDESLPHAHVLYAKLCMKVGAYHESLNLFDEAIRRASMPLNGYMGTSTDQKALAEAESLVQQLVLERTRSRFLLLQNEVSKWDDDNNQLHRGGIPPETSPLVPLSSADKQLEIFPNHPQVLHSKASLLVLSLDDDRDEFKNSTARAWKAYDTFRNAQTSAYEAYSHGKAQRLAGGKPCQLGQLVWGGRAWSNAPDTSSYPFLYNKTTDDDENDLYMGTITLQNIIISGRDAVLSGHGADCHVYVPHPYTNLANSLPIVTSWEAEAMQDKLKMAVKPPLLTHLPEGNNRAYGGKFGKDSISGHDDLIIPDPKLAARGRFHSALLLTGYAAHNYYHFVSEVLPSLVATRKYIRGILEKGNENHVVIVPNLQHEFVEGFLRLLLPEAFPGNKVSPQIVQWGPNRQSNRDDAHENTNLTSPHPIAYASRLISVAWDQPDQAPPPLGGPPHCLTPAPLLRAMRRVMWNAAGASRDADYGNNGKLRVVYCSRTASPTRSLIEEEELLSRIKDEIRDEGLAAEVIMFEKKTDENRKSQSPLEFILDTIQLFQSTAVVVGVHGASLANIAFASMGTTVIEMGLEGLPQASHYRHLSRALELHHVDVFLAKDARSLGATEVRLRKGGIESVVKAVVSGLKKGKRGKKLDRSEV